MTAFLREARRARRGALLLCLLPLLSGLGGLGCGGPGWYAARDVGMAPYLLVGYGDGESLAAARAEAVREIADALGVSVHSTGEMVSQRGADGERRFSRFRVSLVSKAILNDLNTVRLTRASGRYYVALGYDNRTLFQKLDAVPGRSDSARRAHGSGFKASLPLSDNLSFLGIAPSEYRVVRRHGGWSLRVGQELYPLTFGTWFRTLFVEKAENRGLRIGVVPQGPLSSGARYQVHIIPPRATGYLSLYYVSESGQALTLKTNEPVDSLEPVIYPDPALYAGLEAIATGGEGSRDMLLATWNDTPIVPSEAHFPISTTSLVATDERAFSYGDLMEQLGDALWVSRFVWIMK